MIESKYTFKSHNSPNDRFTRLTITRYAKYDYRFSTLPSITVDLKGTEKVAYNRQITMFSKQKLNANFQDW